MTCPALSPPVRNPDFGREGSGGPPGRPGAPRAPGPPRAPPPGAPRGGPPRGDPPGGGSRDHVQVGPGTSPEPGAPRDDEVRSGLARLCPTQSIHHRLAHLRGVRGVPPRTEVGGDGRARGTLSQIGTEVGGGTHPPWTLNIGVGADRLRVSRPARVRSAPSTISPVETWTPGSRPSGGRAGSHLRGVRGVSPRSRVGGPREGTGHSGWGRPGGDLGGGVRGAPRLGPCPVTVGLVCRASGPPPPIHTRVPGDAPRGRPGWLGPGLGPVSGVSPLATPAHSDPPNLDLARTLSP